MEADEFLLKFQGSFLSFSTNGLLNNPTDAYHPENAKKAEIDALSNYIAKLPSTAKCKITYYMVLNTEMKVSDDLKNDYFVGLFVNLTPPLLPQALIKWIDILGLFEELCKVIQNSPPFLSEEIISAVIENPKFLNTEDSCLKLWSSVCKLMCKLEKKNQLQSFSSLVNYFKIICQKLEQCINVKKPSYKNICTLQNVLNAVLNLCRFYKNPDPDDEMYKLGFETKVTTSDEIPNKIVSERVFEILVGIVMSLDFEAWESVPEDLEGLKTLINIASRVTEEIFGENLFSKHVNSYSEFENIEKEQEEAVDLLISNAKNGIKCNWTKEVINTGVAEGDDPQLHRMVAMNLEVLLHKAFELLETSGEEMKELFLAAVKVSHKQDKWLELVFDKFKPDLLVTSNTNKDLVETFNRITNMESIPCNVIMPLCMQSPVQTIRKLCSLAISTRSTNVDVFHKLKPACQLILPSGIKLLDDIVLSLLSEEMTTTEKYSLTDLVAKLKEEDLLSSAFFQNLIKTLKEFLNKNEINKSVLCLTEINFLLGDSREVNRIALLVFMSQVLGYFSWDLTSFSPIKANGRDVCCSIVNKLMIKLDSNMDCEILSRTREEVLKIWVVNQAFFCDLWFAFGKTWHGSGKFDSLILALIHSSSCREAIRMFLMNFGPANTIRTSIILALVKILPVLPLKLWKKALNELVDVWTKMNPTVSSINYEVFEMFLTVWYLLTVQMNRDSNIQPCYNHCLAGFGQLFLSARLEEESLPQSYEQILFIMKSIEKEEFRKNCIAILLPALKHQISSAKEGKKGHFDRIREILTEELTNEINLKLDA